MDSTHLGSGNRIGTVLFVDIVRYSDRPVSEQVELKTRFSALLATALEHSPAADRLVVDTGDGAALCFLGDPEDALFAANSLRSGVLDQAAPPALELRLGINLGPVRIVKDINGHTNVLGDGINVAQRVMGFAQPNQILVSRSYYDMVSRLSPEYGQLFHYVGLHRDKHVREHEVYEVQLAPVAPTTAHSVEPTPPAAVAPPAAGAFAPALLERVTAALAREIGPVARLVVLRAARQAPDARALGEAAALHVPEKSRGAFLATLGDLLGAPAPRPTGPAPDAPAEAPARPRALDPAAIARAEALLARHIGPLARVLVQRAAAGATGTGDLFQRLAAHLDDEAARRAFLAEAERGAGAGPPAPRPRGAAGYRPAEEHP